MGHWAKQSTAVSYVVGPILDSTGAEYASAVIGDLSISKNGGTLTALASAATLVYVANGQYTLTLTTGNTDTLGTARILCNKSTYQMPTLALMVLPATVYDALTTNALGVAGGFLQVGSNAATSFTAGLTITQSTGNAAGLSITGNGTGAGILATGGSTGAGIRVIGGSSSGDGVYVTTTSGHGLLSYAGGTSKSGIYVIGSDAVAGNAGGVGMRILGGLASTSSGGTAGIGMTITGGPGAASTNGAATGLSVTGGGTNTVASNAHGLLVTGKSTGNGFYAASGSGATGDAIAAVASSTNGNGFTLIGSGTGLDLNLNSGKANTPNVLRTNTAQAGAASTITLDASANATDSFYKDTVIAIVSGTGAGQCRRYSSYAGATKVYTVDSAWTTNPDNTSAFVILASGSSGGTTPPTAAAIATAVWQDTTASDFTVASSVGKSLMNGVSLGTGLTVARCTLTDTLTTYTDNTPQTGDSFARIGAAGAGLTALGDTRIANLDAAVSSRMATYTQPTGFLAATFPGTVASTTNITAGTITTTTNVTTVNGIAANAITAAALASDAVTEIQAGISTLTQAQVTGGAYALNSASFAFNAALPLTTQMKADVTAAVPTAAAVTTAVWASGTRTLTSLSGLTVDTVTTLTNLPAIPANWLTAAGTAADFGTEVGTAVWATTTRVLTAGTNITGLSVNVIELNGDAQAVTGLTSAGIQYAEDGRFIVHAETVGVGAIAAASFTANALDAVWSAATRTLTSLPTAPTDWITAAALSSAAVAEIQSGLSTYAGGDTSGTTTLLSRLTETRAGYVDNLSAGAVATAANLATVAGYLDTEISAILEDTGTTLPAQIAALTFSTHSAADVWAVGTRLLTAGTNIVLAKGTGVTGFTDLSAAQVNAEVDTAISDVGLTTTVTGRIDAAMSSRATLAAADVWAVGTRTLTSGEAPSAATIADAVWDEALDGHTTAGTAGKLLTTAANGGSSGGMTTETVLLTITTPSDRFADSNGNQLSEVTVGQALTALVVALLGDRSGVDTAEIVAAIPGVAGGQITATRVSRTAIESAIILPATE